jgi:DNA (cytosine-5)-methyltransferase 1
VSAKRKKKQKANSKKIESSKKQAYTCIDLFAGAGGFSLAAIQAGVKVVAAVEFDKAAAKTYEENIPRIQNPAPDIYCEDILGLEPGELVEKTGVKEFGCDIVLGGPPCQGFSAHRIKDAGVGDDRNELILRYFEYVSTINPKLFLMENVPGILWERHSDYLNEFYAEGKKAKYKVLPPVVLDARDFGIPQRRKRVFIVGIREDLAKLEFDWPPRPTHGDEKARKEDKNLKPWVSAAKIFSTKVAAGDDNNIHMNHRADLVEVFKSTPPNGGSRHQSNRILPCHTEHNGHKDVYGRIDPSKPAPTMTTACINPSKGRFLHPTEHHGITVRQAARFQTFPDWYVFQGGMMAAAKQVGNAVPVAFGEILIKKMSTFLDKHYLGLKK